MVNCNYISVARPDGLYELTCQTCQKTIISARVNGKFPCTGTVEKVSRASIKCTHIGPELRLANCPTCNGTVQLKVFGCELHGECTIAKQLDGVKCCKNCEDYSNVEVSISQNP